MKDKSLLAPHNVSVDRGGLRRRITVVFVIAALGVLLVTPAFAQTPDGLVPVCVGRSGALTATVGIQTLPAALEIDLLLANGGQATIQFDPSKAVLRTAEWTASPWTANETKRAHRDLGAYILGGAIFPPLVVISAVSQWNFNRYVDARVFHAGPISPGQTARGSLFFPLAPDRQTRATLELTGLAPASGGIRPLKMYCGLPRGTSVQAVVQAFPPLTVSLAARGSAGPVEVAVETVEFAPDYTAIELSVSNSAETSAEIFNAMVNASLRDGTGITYDGRPARGEFPDRIPARTRITARLVFAPLPAPPKTAAATLRIPGVWFGPENVVDVTVELKF